MTIALRARLRQNTPMPRLPRVVVPHMPRHLTRSGSRCWETLFRDDGSSGACRGDGRMVRGMQSNCLSEVGRRFLNSVTTLERMRLAAALQPMIHPGEHGTCPPGANSRPRGRGHAGWERGNCAWGARNRIDTSPVDVTSYLQEQTSCSGMAWSLIAGSEPVCTRNATRALSTWEVASGCSCVTLVTISLSPTGECMWRKWQISFRQPLKEKVFDVLQT